MAKDLLLGIDIGTSACKVGLFTQEGGTLASATAEYPTQRPANGWAEQNAEDWWNVAAGNIRRVLAEARVDAARIAGIGVSNMSTTVLPVNGAGDPVRAAIIWPDTRAVEECRWLLENVGQERVSRITHNVIGTFMGLTKMLWFKQHQPELFAETHAFLQAGGYIVLRLTGEFSMNLSDIEMTGLGDAGARTWSDELCGLVGIPPAKLPRIFKCFEVVGAVTPAAADRTGLVAGTPVVAGSTDIAAAALVAGVTSPGQAFIDAGHATNLAVCVDKPTYHPGLIFFGSVAPDLWLIEGASGFTGASMRWLRDTICNLEVEKAADLGLSPYELLDLEAAKSPPGARGVIFVPYLNGALCPLWDPKARGMFFGLSLATRREDLIRAVIEGCALDLLLNLEAIQSLGVDVQALVITGGGSKSPVWNQARADIMGKRLTVVTDSGGSVLGAALLGGIGAGLYRDPADAFGHLRAERREYPPRPEHAVMYGAMYRLYRNLYEKLGEEFDALRELTAQ
ncbi:MAG: xylulokinase [Patescibacteria group bacterium]